MLSGLARVVYVEDPDRDETTFVATEAPDRMAHRMSVAERLVARAVCAAVPALSGERACGVVVPVRALGAPGVSVCSTLRTPHRYSPGRIRISMSDVRLALYRRRP